MTLRFWQTATILLLSLGASAFTSLSDETLKSLPAAGADFDIKTGSILAPILVPRVPGTPGIFAVQAHFVDWFKTNLPNWNLEFQNSTSKTPATGDKEVPFSNIIITRDPPWTQSGDVGRLSLVAHYDSKLTPAGFIGATDSAAPCAIIMHVARSIDEALTKKWDAMVEDGTGGSGLEEEKGIQILFLDGEEAFVSWTHTDSLYGARSLAEEWETTMNPAMSVYKTMLNSISLFVLLDLLGSTDPRVPSYFPTTHWAYQELAGIELRLRSLGLLQSKPKNPFLPDKDKTSDKFGRNFVEDDHVPFMARGVDILHMIPTPFPHVWHTMQDDGEHLDIPSVEDWARIMTVFAGEWMDLEGFFPSKLNTEADFKDNRAVSSKTEL